MVVIAGRAQPRDASRGAVYSARSTSRGRGALGRTAVAT